MQITLQNWKLERLLDIEDNCQLSISGRYAKVKNIMR